MCLKSVWIVGWLEYFELKMKMEEKLNHSNGEIYTYKSIYEQQIK